MKIVRNSQLGHGDRIFIKVISFLTAIILLAASIPYHMKTVWASQESAKAIYLDGQDGDDTQDGITLETAVKSFQKAQSLVEKGGTIYVSGTVTVTKETQWSLSSGISFQRADGFTAPIVEVKTGGKLTLNYAFIKEADMKLADADSYAITEAKKKEESTELKESADSETEKVLEETQDSAAAEKAEEENAKEKEVQTSEKIPAKDIVIPASITIDTAIPLSKIPLTQCSGDGVFSWADGEFVTDAYESTCEVIFSPNDTKTYDYSGVSGWDANEGIVKRSMTVFTTSLNKVKEVSKEDSAVKEEENKAEAAADDESAAKEEVSETTKDQVKDNEETKEEETTQTKETLEKEKVTETEKKTKSDENKQDKIDSAVESISKSIAGLSDVAGSESEVREVVAVTKAYQALSDKQQKKISAENLKKLTAAQESCKSINLTSNEVTVTGDFIPWYVQFRATLNQDTESLSKPNVETVLSAYELKLWNLLTDEEYEIPEGKKVTVFMPAPDEMLFDRFVVVHYLKDGSVEYITPVIKDGILSFETCSFSPFDVAGSKILVGASGDGEPTDTTSLTEKVNETVQNNKSLGASSQSSTSSGGKGYTVIKSSAVATGDNAVFLPYIIGAAAALLIIILLIVLRNKKKK